MIPTTIGRAGINPRGDWPEGGTTAYPLDRFRHNNSAWLCKRQTVDAPAAGHPSWMLDTEGIAPGPDGYLLSTDGKSLFWTKSPYGKPVSEPTTWYIRPDGNDEAATLLYLSDPQAGENTSTKAFRSLYAAWCLFAENFFLTGQGSIKFLLGAPGTYEDSGPLIYQNISVLSPANITDMDGVLPRRRVSIVGDRSNPASYVYKYSSFNNSWWFWYADCIWEGVTLLLTTAAGYSRPSYGLITYGPGQLTLWDCGLSASNGPTSTLVSLRGAAQTYGKLLINNQDGPAKNLFECIYSDAHLSFDRSDGATGAGNITINGDSSEFNGAVFLINTSGLLRVYPPVTWAGAVPSAKRYIITSYGQLITSGRLTAIPGLAGTVDAASFALAS